MKETLIIKTELSNLFDPIIIRMICSEGYLKTGCKFSIVFNGSKGYLSNLQVICEGVQKEENRIFDFFNKNMSVKKKVVNIYHSHANGIRLSLGNDEPRLINESQFDSIQS